MFFNELCRFLRNSKNPAIALEKADKSIETGGNSGCAVRLFALAAGHPRRLRLASGGAQQGCPGQ